MKKTTLIVVILSIVILIISTNSFTIDASDIKSTTISDKSKPTPIFSKFTMIHGRVLELTLSEGLKPSVGATVHCIGIGINNKKYPFNETRITDENGNYSFGEKDNFIVPLPGLYLLYVTKEGYIPCPITPLTGFALVRKRFIDGFFLDESDIAPVWPPLLLVQNIFNPGK